jgi:AcrR family transcriptional regulator
MIIPVAVAEAPSASCEWSRLEPEWSKLEPLAKRERLLDAAAAVFSRDGLDAPMSEVAEAAGAGVASVYRCYPSKHELLAALVTRRMDEIATAATAARGGSGDRWSALTGMLTAVVERQTGDDFLSDARVLVSDRPAVAASAARATAALEALMADARAEGRLRADATTLDVKLLFAATRAARKVEPDGWPRMLELLLRALDARACGEDPA